MKSNQIRDPFIYLEQKEWEEDVLPDRHAAHYRRVLRISGNFAAVICNGGGITRRVMISGKDRIESLEPDVHHVRPRKIGVHAAAFRRKNLEWMIQKLSELGVSRIRIGSSERSERNFKTWRLHEIAENACMQSRNSFLPEITISEDSILQTTVKAETGYWGDWESEATGVKTEGELNFFNGPEGGWSPAEKEKLKNNFQAVKLSENVLRAETAAVAFCARFLI